MPQQFLYAPRQAYRVSRRVLPGGEMAEVYTAHRGFVLFWPESGSCRLDLGDESLLADGASLVLLGPDRPCRLEACGSADAVLLQAEFSAEELQPLAAACPACDLAGFLAAEPCRLVGSLPAAAVQDVRFLLTKQLALCSVPAPAPAAETEGRLLLAALLLELAELCATHHRRGDDRQLARLVRRYIAVHYAEPLDLDALAARFRCSRWHLCHAFKAGTGQSPIECLNRTRVQAACALLQADAALPLAEVARRCGFSGPAQLRRLLKEKTGQTPRQLRRAPV